jgi:high-affinity iron transporter
VEALLVVGLLHALLRQQEAGNQALRFLWWGVGGGVGMAFLLALSLARMESLLGANAQDIFATVLVWVAAVLIVQMVLWMRIHGRRLHGHFKARSGEALASGSYWGIAVLAAIAIGREGAETVIFLYGMSSAQQAAGDWLAFGGAVLAAIGLAALTYWLLQLGSRWLSWRLFFRFSEVVLLLLAASLVMSGVDRVLSLGWLPAGIDPLWDSSTLLDDSTRFGGVVAALTGYRAYPAETGVIAYVSFWLLVAGLFQRQKRATLREQRQAA